MCRVGGTTVSPRWGEAPLGVCRDGATRPAVDASHPAAIDQLPWGLTRDCPPGALRRLPPNDLVLDARLHSADHVGSGHGVRTGWKGATHEQAGRL